MCKIKIKCKHEYNINVSLSNYKQIGEFTVIRGLGLMRLECEKCGHTFDQVISGGYIIQSGDKDG